MKLLVLIIFSINSFALVKEPNYDFSLDELKIFSPMNPLAPIKEKYPDLKKVKEENGFAIYKTYHTQLRYKFPILIQVKKDTITDFYARLPAYFLHDVFHQSLINRYKMQDYYKKHEEQAIYIWKPRDNIHHVYSGACSITCFPIYYAQYPDKHDFGALVPIIKIIHNNYVENFEKTFLIEEDELKEAEKPKGN